MTFTTTMNQNNNEPLGNDKGNNQNQNHRNFADMKVRGKGGLRDEIRAMLNDIEKHGELPVETISEMRQITRDGSKAMLVGIANELATWTSTKPSSSNGNGATMPSSSNSTKPSTSSSNEPTMPSSSNEPSTNNQPELDNTDDIVEKVTEKVLKAIGNSMSGINLNPKPSVSNGKLFHWQFELLKTVLEINKQALVVGGAGSGKTTIAEQIAEELGFDVEKEFFVISLSAGVSEAHLSGRMVMNGDFISTKFLDIVENGGVILLDEFDNADPDVMVGLNSLLANGVISTPLDKTRDTVIRNENCYIIATGNTWGNGSNGSSGYVRKQHDAATLDRFSCSKIELGTDARIIDLCYGITDENVKYPKPFMLFDDEQSPISMTELEAVKFLRETYYYLVSVVKDNRRGINKLVGTRFAKQGSDLVRRAKMHPYSVLELYFNDWTDDQLRTVGITRTEDTFLDVKEYDFTTFAVNVLEHSKTRGL